MVSAPTDSDDAVLDKFLSRHGHETESVGWQQDYNKKQCPECSALHELAATECSVCGWSGISAD